MKFKLQAVRKEAGFKSAAAFAEAIGMPKDTYTGYEQGKTRLTLEQAWEFAEFLGEVLGRYVTLDELAGRDFVPACSEPSSDLSTYERFVVEAMRSTDARGRATIIRNAEGEVGVEGPSSAGIGSDGMKSIEARGA